MDQPNLITKSVPANKVWAKEKQSIKNLLSINKTTKMFIFRLANCLNTSFNLFQTWDFFVVFRNINCFDS